MREENDWRLRGQEKYLTKAKLFWRPYIRPRESWDHDHCEFCWDKFMDDGTPNTLPAGYETAEKHRWICLKCFADFADMFDWVVENPGDAPDSA